MSVSNTDDKKVIRLRRLLILFFLALLIPTVALLLFAAEQMKWETYHQFRQQAESLTSRIDQEIIAITETENLRRSTDYQFLVIEEGSTNNAFRRSPLAQLPKAGAIPGLIGHFQIEADGRLTSPLIPAPGIRGEDYGVNNIELNDRKAIASQLREILIGGNLTQLPAAGKANLPTLIPKEVATSNDSLEEKADLAFNHNAETKFKQTLEKEAIQQFDQQTEESNQQNSRRFGSVADLRLDESLEQRALEQRALKKRAMDRTEAQVSKKAAAATGNRAASVQNRRKEQTNTYDFSKVLPQSESYSGQAALSDDADEAVESWQLDNTDNPPPATPATIPSAPSDVAELSAILPRARPDAEDKPDTFITSFESEVDPFKLAIFGEDHIVLYRNVWRNNERIIQGAVVNRDTFVETLIHRSFLATPLATMSQLLVAFKDDVLNIYGQANTSRYASTTKSLTGSVLYRSKLAEPFNHFSLIFNIDNLPLGSGIKYLVWVAAVLLCVLIGGCYFMYKFGKGQIALYRQQQDFVSAVSHELKTPLTSIRMYSEMLKNSWATEDKKPGYYDYIHSESERLSRLIENVLQLARINRQQSDLKIEAINVGELMANALSKLGSLIDTSNFTLSEQFDPQALEAKLDCSQDATLQILINIVDNAIKFSRNADKKEIALRLNKLTNGAIEIGIRDYGPGIEQTQMKKIFELFYRTENELTRETVGTGIGLALAHQLATAMEARIDARNCEPGVEFTLTWPASAVRTKELTI